jgi:hypothetical protein
MGPDDQNGEARKLTPRRAFKRPQKRPGNGPFFSCCCEKKDELQRLASGLNFNAVVLQTCFVGFQRDHAGGCHHVARADIERAIVKVALNHIALNFAL